MAAEPVWQMFQPTVEIFLLRMLAHQLMLKLPALVGAIRDVRRQSEQCDGRKTLDTSIASLAKHLLQYEDCAAETAVLHRVHILKTGSPIGRENVWHSFHFPSIDEMEAAMLYWMCRLHITTLCLHIALNVSEETDQNCSPIYPLLPAPFNTATLHAEQTRLLTNIFMSWHYTNTHGRLFATPMSTILLFVWGALEGEVCFRGLPIEKVKHWVLEKYRESAASLPVACEMDEKQMEQTSELLAGGAEKGMMVRLRERARMGDG